MLRIAAVVGLLCLFAATTVSRAQPTTQPVPFPRVETGSHEADINAVAVLPGGVSVVTVSDDKSARVWSADTLVAQGVARPPIGPRDDGALYTVAVNAKLIAVAGRVRDTTGHFAIQFFALPDLRPVGSIDGLAQPVFALAFSPDGNMLAAGMMDGGGVRFFDLKARTPIPPDTAYRGSVTALAFNRAGQLAVAAADGALRLYDAGGHRLGGNTPLRNGARPFGLAFSPDGGMLAVGDRQHAMVHLFTLGANGRLSEGADLQGAAGREGSFDFVAFATDGRSVFGAGSYKDAGGQRYIRRWGLDGRTASETPVARDTVTALLPVGDGLIFCTADPAIGRLDASGRVTARIGTRHIDFRNAALDSFRISFDGSTIGLPLSGRSTDDNAKRTLLFNTQLRQFVSPSAATRRMTLFFATVGRLSITEWLNSHTPKLNNNPIALEPDEISHAIAVMPDGSGAAIGTDFYLRFVTPLGERWRQVVSSAAWAVNISGDGRVVVAGLSDGTVHWYDTATGNELLALYVDPASDRFPQGRFVVWTPNGFFDHDHPNDGRPDGRELIGYQFNAADHRSSKLVEIGQLYDRFFRPDLVGLAFRNDPTAQTELTRQRDAIGSVQQAIASGLPPQIVVVDVCGRDAALKSSSCPDQRPYDVSKPADRPGVDLQTPADSVLVQWKLTDPNGVPGRVRVQRDGSVLRPELFVDEESAHSRTEEAEIALGDGLNTIRLTPVGAGGAVEAAVGGVAEIKIFRTAPQTRSIAAVAPGTPPASVPAPTRPRTLLYVLSVGVSQFGRSELNLPNADRDATAVVDLMQGDNPPVYDHAVVKLLTNQQATAANILAALQDIAARALPDDLVLIFLAGHGQAVDGKYYFAPTEFGTADPDLFLRAIAPLRLGGPSTDHPVDELFRREGLGQDNILSVIQTIKASRVALILDTCFSAALATQDAVLRRDLNSTVTNGIGHSAGRFVLSSAINLALDTAGIAATATPLDEQGHGLFTSFLLRGLQGDADFDHKGRIDVYKLANYTVDHVQAATASMAQVQEPTYFFNGSQFFALRATSIGTGQ